MRNVTELQFEVDKGTYFSHRFLFMKICPNPKANFQKATLMLIDCGLKLQRTKLSLDGKCHGDKYFTANNLFLRGLPQPPANCFTICRLTFKCKKLPPMMINDDHQWSIVLQFWVNFEMQKLASTDDQLRTDLKLIDRLIFEGFDFISYPNLTRVYVHMSAYHSLWLTCLKLT